VRRATSPNRPRPEKAGGAEAKWRLSRTPPAGAVVTGRDIEPGAARINGLLPPGNAQSNDTNCLEQRGRHRYCIRITDFRRSVPRSRD
jgi:hypothetical protein